VNIKSQLLMGLALGCLSAQLPLSAGVVSKEDVGVVASTSSKFSIPGLTHWTGDGSSLDVYYIGHDHNLYNSWYNGATWVSNDNLGAAAAQPQDAPSSVSWGGWEWTFWGASRDQSNPLMYEYYDPASGFHRGANVASGLKPFTGGTPVIWGNYYLDLFYVTGDGLAHKYLYFPDNAPEAWVNGGNLGQIPFTPSSAVYSPTYDLAFIFGRGESNQLWYFSYRGEVGVGSITPYNLGINTGPFGPQAVLANNKIHLFWNNSTRNLMHMELETGRTEDLGGCLFASPSVTSRGDARIDIVFRGCSDDPGLKHWVYMDDGQ
jgi:hypothetical protein